MLYLGVMSGTSCDGIDVALVEVSGDEIRCQATHFEAYQLQLKKQLLSVIAGQPLTASAFSLLDQQLAVAYADAIHKLLSSQNLSLKDIQAIGLHGQTIDHQPPKNTWQLGSAAHVAALTGIDVVADFRSMDVALGGQGAPLAPALHKALFFQGDEVVVLNLGGIANVSFLSDLGFSGFDTGPANCLMDLWVQKHQNKKHDECGQWAKTGQVHQGLLQKMLTEQYFSLAAPKSTGRELFNQEWLAGHLNCFSEVSAADVQATLLQLTVQTIAGAVNQQGTNAQQMIVCGGGVHNLALMHGLSSSLDFDVVSSENFGVDPDHVESVLMAWLAACHNEGKALDMSAVTGASKSHVYGVKYPAPN